jgi:cytoskeletal protein RodZ
MKKTSIHPADAADDMQRCYDREVRRHRRQRRRTINMVVSWGVVVVLIATVGFALLKRNDARSLPKAAFEVAAERTASAKKPAAKPKTTSTAARPSSKSSGGTKVASAKTSSKKTASKPAASSASTVAKTSINAPITAASAAAPHAIHIRVSSSGYSPSRVTAPAGVPIAITLDGVKGGDYVGFEMPTLHVTANNDGQAVTIELPALKPGTYHFASFVGTIQGTLVVK